MVTMAKGIGNGFPMGAVVTTAGRVTTSLGKVKQPRSTSAMTVSQVASCECPFVLSLSLEKRDELEEIQSLLSTLLFLCRCLVLPLSRQS